VLLFASYFGKLMSETMRSIMTRIIGMIVLASSVEMVAQGATAVLPGLA